MSAKRDVSGQSVDNDHATIFPVSKIKAQIRRDDGVGKLSSQAVEFIGACSEAFLQNLVADASKMKNNHGRSRSHDEEDVEGQDSKVTCTLEQIQTCVTMPSHNEKYDFLEETVASAKDKSAPRVVGKKRKRVTAKGSRKGTGTAPASKTTTQSALGKAMRKQGISDDSDGNKSSELASSLQHAIERAQATPINRAEIIADDDDYD